MKSDEELMVALSGGDDTAFRELFDRYAPILRRVLTRSLDLPEEANDLLQQTFLQLFRARADYQPGRALRPWLFTIALNLKRQYFRTRRRRPAALELTPKNEPTSSAPSALENVEAQQLRAALETLPAVQRDAIVLHWLEGLSFPEIAQILGVSESALKVRAHRGYAQLRALLGRSDEPVTDS